MNTISIPLHKNRDKKLFSITALLALLGILVVIAPQWFIKSDNTLVATIAGYVLLVFFGLFALLFGKRLLDKTPGLVVDKEGITDYTGGASAGKLRWEDVRQLDVIEIEGQKFIRILLRNPLEYLEQEKDPFKKRIKQINFRLYQTPFCIAARSLQVDFEELYRILQDGLEKNGRWKP